MGLIVPQIVKVKTGAVTCKHYREKGYEFEKCGDIIEVNVFDLPKGSHAKVKIICDVCGKESETRYSYVVKCNEENELITCLSNSCANKKRKDTCAKKYGVKSVAQLEEVKEKIKQTNLERYGCESAAQNEEIKNKIKETNLERYGHECTLQAEEVKKKIKETLKEKYGEDVVNISQVKEIQDKIKATNIERYGVENATQSKIIQNRIKATNLERHGYEYPFQSQEVQNKIKATNLEKYGSENVMQNKEIQNKLKKTLQEKYGKNITCSFQVESVKEKSKQTLLKNYGVENATQSTIIQDRIKETNLERYGYEYSFQSKEIQKKIKVTMMKRYGTENPMQNEEIQNKMKATCKERYGADNVMQNEDIKNKILSSFQFNHTGPSSRAQRYINYILNGILNKHICGSLVDIYMEKENIIIEYDGSGHFLGDIINGNISPTKESLLYEKEREDKIINNGYRMIRFIAAKDRIPSDEVILNLIEGFKNSDFKVIRINFEENTIDRDYEEKWYCNFGKLRKITKEDLEKFKKQEENTSEN